MGLNKYNKKRDFSQTSEPAGEVDQSGQNRFVVQEHHARRLHYDFRLEAEGVLKSWAVPKGPSMDPADKRLAVMTEDHPVSYIDFAGTIPKGNYGAGEVYLWDNGTYELLDSDSFDEGFEEGKLKFILHGEKLKGMFSLVKMKGKGENQWLLIKGKDEEAAGDGDVPAKNSKTKKKSPVRP